MASQQYRAITNQFCFKKLKENIKDVNSAGDLCASHTLSNAEKQSTVVVNYVEDFSNKSHKVIQYTGKVWYLVRDVFDETILDAVGIIFFVKYEQFFQIATYGHKKFMEEVLPVCNQTIGQICQQRSCYRHMSLRENQLIWVWRYWNFQILLMASIFCRNVIHFGSGLSNHF